MHQDQFPSITRALFDQIVPDFSFFPHVLFKPTKTIISEVARISGIKYGPWPYSPEHVCHYLVDDICDEPEKFSSWAREPCQQEMYQYASCQAIITNEALLVNAETDVRLLRSIFSEFVLKSDAFIWQSLVHAMENLDSVGIPIDPDNDFFLFVFARNKSEVVAEIIEWAKSNQIPWGQLIPPQPPIGLSGPLFDEMA